MRIPRSLARGLDTARSLDSAAWRCSAFPTRSASSPSTAARSSSSARRAPGADGRTLELPAGTIEDGETPEECAARELVEECGLTAASWRKLGEFWAAPDYSTEYVHAFEATELTDVGIGDREEGDDLVIERLPLRGVLAELSDANSLATLALWLQG